MFYGHLNACYGQMSVLLLQNPIESMTHQYLVFFCDNNVMLWLSGILNFGTISMHVLGPLTLPISSSCDQ